MTGIAVLGRTAVFVLTLVVGTLTTWLASEPFPKLSERAQPVSNVSGSGDGGAFPGKSFYDQPASFYDAGPGLRNVSDPSALRIFSKPRPEYTELARINQVNGSVILRVTFLASGKIGSVEPVKTLPNGLTEQAVEAAKRIKFHPKLEAGRPVTVVKKVEYTFTIY